MRQLAAVLLSCALFPVVLLTGSSTKAYAQGYYGASGQAVVDNAESYLGMPYGASGMTCSGFTSMVFADLGVYLRIPGRPVRVRDAFYGKPATWCSSTRRATVSARRNRNRLRDGDPRLDLLQGDRGDTHRIRTQATWVPSTRIECRWSSRPLYAVSLSDWLSAFWFRYCECALRSRSLPLRTFSLMHGFPVEASVKESALDARVIGAVRAERGEFS